MPEKPEVNLETTVRELWGDTKVVLARSERLENEVFGNGRPGLKDQVAKLGTILKILTGVITALFAAIVSDIVARVLN